MSITLKRSNIFTLFLFVAVLALTVVAPMALQTLDMEGFMDTDAMFDNANILLGAFGTLVMLVVGFHLAKIVIRFVIQLFQGFSI
ncbi:MAG: hypothetical protein DRJ03_16295 [Chloroflexi bacterium]|nr:MAG: hypothetical protein DRJ03_16295 [Chloroflexota bacterium]